ncbi:MAG: hypothetical protein MZV63_61950 [Marinilabiliales bacterium]|nr:hypothetical protein [Marinilabiliales bacterium]
MAFPDGGYYTVPAIGAGVRIRNDQLVLNTLQIRLAWYPNTTSLLRISHGSTSAGVKRLKPPGF